ncbi:unnamed protein product [Urochloa humidicola]
MLTRPASSAPPAAASYTAVMPPPAVAAHRISSPTRPVALPRRRALRRRQNHLHRRASATPDPSLYSVGELSRRTAAPPVSGADLRGTARARPLVVGRICGEAERRRWLRWAAEIKEARENGRYSVLFREIKLKPRLSAAAPWRTLDGQRSASNPCHQGQRCSASVQCFSWA